MTKTTRFTAEDYDAEARQLRGTHSPFNTGRDGKSIEVSFVDWETLERHAAMLQQAAQMARRLAKIASWSEYDEEAMTQHRERGTAAQCQVRALLAEPVK